MMKRIFFSCLVLFLFSGSFMSFDRATDTQKAYINKAYFSKVLFEEVNKVRLANGRSGLAWDSVCTKAALEQARYCAKKGKLSHTQDNPDMRDVKKRYRYYKGEASTVGENLLTLDFRIPNHHAGDSITDRIARRYNAAAKFMVSLWMQSPPHKKNLLYADYKSAGIAMVYTNRLQVYVGQVFVN
jgi:uncharacterized protein YkwD